MDTGKVIKLNAAVNIKSVALFGNNNKKDDKKKTEK